MEQKKVMTIEEAAEEWAMDQKEETAWCILPEKKASREKQKSVSTPENQSKKARSPRRSR